MTAPVREPCAEIPKRPTPADGRKVHITHLLATGSSGGAQEHVYSLLTALDRDRYEAEVVSLTEGSAP
ncbi:MAG: hypothetical protein M3301_01550, partial [Chloroflexota bacterium]|nr:hypothetical protein [Chloroflexota bacterium]